MKQVYDYEYDPDATMEENARNSQKMDILRATMGPTSEQLVKQQPTTNGKVEVSNNNGFKDYDLEKLRNGI